MNRRNFIQKTILGSSLIPLISTDVFSEPKSKLFDSETIEILSLNELKNNGIRSAIYSASCVDKNGKFPLDVGFDYKHNEPFVRQTYGLECLPILAPISGGLLCNIDCISLSKNRLINEIKEKMEYVCLVWYVNNGKSWIPVVGGLTKHKYQFMVDNMNVKNKLEYNKLCEKYMPLLEKDGLNRCNPWV